MIDKFSLESNKRGECNQLVEYIDYYDYRFDISY